MAADEGLNPYDYQKIFGITFCKHEHAPLISVGRGKGEHAWTRWELGRLGVPHSAAAVRLNRIIQQLRIASLDELAQQAHAIGNYKGLGVTCYAVLLAILRASGYDIEQVHETDVTYASMKRRAMKDEEKPRKRRR